MRESESIKRPFEVLSYGCHRISKTLTSDETYITFQPIKKAKSTGLVKATKFEVQKTVTTNWYTTKTLPEIL
ncbi:hypothetical protein TNCV_3407601 [Trichonephila clavipes]|uniref:Uncharacterized protein n=1 Tax=Trichonephila clavipes TaxID=2585209 RepID=A0A8X6UXZ8_TRICX|nr:hypothetical protein TNCV_3407601 [Trichonephila clavipes]